MSQPGTTSQKAEREVHFDLLRVFSVFCVVVLHLAARNWSTLPPESMSWVILNAFDSLVRFCVPVLVMISGVFFLDPGKEIPPAKLYGKHIARIAIAFAFWSTLYALQGVLPEIQAAGVGAVDIPGLLSRIVKGHYHLWYLPMIIGVYMIAPFLRRMVEDRRLTEYFLLLWFIFGILLRTMDEFAGMGLMPEVSLIRLPLVMGYSGYFVLGHYLSAHKPGRMAERWIYVAGLAGLLATFTLTWAASRRMGKPLDLFYEYLTPNVMAQSVAVFVFFARRLSEIRYSKGFRKATELLSSCSFGVYLIHLMLLDSPVGYRVVNVFKGPLIRVPVVSVALFLVSLGVIALMRKLKFFRTYLS